MVDRLIPDLTTTGIRGAGDSARRLIQEVNGWDVVYDFDDFTNDKSDADSSPAILRSRLVLMALSTLLPVVLVVKQLSTLVLVQLVTTSTVDGVLENLNTRVI
jgi:hypothetical protein